MFIYMRKTFIQATFSYMQSIAIVMLIKCHQATVYYASAVGNKVVMIADTNKWLFFFFLRT